MSFEKPNYTQTPNVFYDEILPQITSHAETKVTLAIMRQTFGFHRDEDELSISRLVELTGLHRDSVIEGTKLALERGTITRRRHGQSYLYSVQLVGNSDHPKNPSSRKSRQEVVGESDPQLVGNSDTRKKEGKKQKESSPTPSETTSPQSSGAPPADFEDSEEPEEPEAIRVEKDQPTAADFIAILDEDLRGADVPLLPGRKSRYGREFRQALERGVEADVLYRAADRIVERWSDDNHFKLTVEQAIGDVANGSSVRSNGSVPFSKGHGSPPELVAELAAHDTFRRYASVAQSFDFTACEYPPPHILRQLGGTDNERWSNADRIMQRAAGHRKARPA